MAQTRYNVTFTLDVEGPDSPGPDITEHLERLVGMELPSSYQGYVLVEVSDFEVKRAPAEATPVIVNDKPPDRSATDVLADPPKFVEARETKRARISAFSLEARCPQCSALAGTPDRLCLEWTAREVSKFEGSRYCLGCGETFELVAQNTVEVR